MSYFAESYVTELQVLTGDDVRDELACPCRPHISLCGKFNPNDVSIDFVDDDDVNLCPDCLHVWTTSGCGVCRCRPERICAGCAPKWEECQSGNGSAC